MQSHSNSPRMSHNFQVVSTKGNETYPLINTLESHHAGLEGIDQGGLLKVRSLGTFHGGSTHACTPPYLAPLKPNVSDSCMTASFSTSLSSSAGSDNGGSYAHRASWPTRLQHSETCHFDLTTQNTTNHEFSCGNGGNGAAHDYSASRVWSFTTEPQAAQKQQPRSHLSFIESDPRSSIPRRQVSAPSSRFTGFGLHPVATPSTPATLQPLYSAHPFYTVLGQHEIWQGIPRDISLMAPQHYRRRFTTPGNQS